MVYLFSLVLDVVAAVLGLGPLVALGLGSQDRRLALLASFGLGLLLLTGIGMLAVTQGAYARAPWLRVSFALFLLIGGAVGQVRVALRKGNAERAQALAWVA